MGQWPNIPKSCKFQNFNGPFKILMGPLQNLMGPRILKLISTLEQNWHEIWIAYIHVWGLAKSKVHFRKAIKFSHKIQTWGDPRGMRLNGLCMRRSRILSERGGGGSKPNGEKTALIFYCFFFCLFFCPKFSGMRGVQLFTGGGEVPNSNFYRIWSNLWFTRNGGPDSPPLDPQIHDI